MNKKQLIDAAAKSADISNAAATRTIDAAIALIKSALMKGQTVSLTGLGTFHVTQRAARKGRNPRTGASITIKATKAPKFRPSKALKDAVK